jgi:hypothetical protein
MIRFALAVLAALVPIEFIAFTVNVYVVLAVNPETNIGDPPMFIPVNPPGLLVAV